MVLLWAIGLSVLAVILESVASIRQDYGSALRVAEWVFTILFTVEYVLRLTSVERPVRYALSFFGVVDVLAILPTYLSLIVGGAQTLLVVRALRLLRLFRVFKLGRYTGQVQTLKAALKASIPKITVFLGTVLTLVLIVGTLMYLIEGEANGFTSIPTSIYWAIVTMTTVGYGNVTPQTTLGQILAATVMIMGYGIIAVPTGIVSVELAQAKKYETGVRACRTCSADGHDTDAQFCKKCGARLG